MGAGGEVSVGHFDLDWIRIWSSVEEGAVMGAAVVLVCRGVCYYGNWCCEGTGCCGSSL